MMNRKKLFQHILWILIVAECFPMLAVAASKQKEQRYKIAVCDWMILKRQKIGSFQLVHELKGDGVELDMGSLGKREMRAVRNSDQNSVNQRGCQANRSVSPTKP